MNAISTITVLPRTSTEVAAYVESVKNEFLSGYVNPLDFAVHLKSMEEIVKQLRADIEIRRAIEDEADKYTEKTIDYSGVKIAKSERKSYSFEGCQCSRWEDARQREIQAKTEREGIEKWLKTLSAITPDMATGEAVNPPAYETTSILSITLKK